MSDGAPYRLTAGGILLAVRVTPNARSDRLEGVRELADGAVVLRLKVRAVPDNGQANLAVAKLLSQILGVPKSAITLVQGQTSRRKQIAIAGDGPRLVQRLETVLETLEAQ